MSKNAKRRRILMTFLILICVVVLLLTNIHNEKMIPAAYNYYIANAPDEAQMPNAVTAIYLRYRIFDTLFEALLLAVAVSVVVYFASAWERGKEDIPDE